ncbi:MAG: hypothetical protein I8H98_04585 [Moraxellaceae bacterium]|nr:hypothetical protein [Moraxellaceae bacterium]MBH2029771.1 hypothetical protein [Moraxellaceae bacterium]
MDALGWYFQYFSVFGVGIHVIIALCFAIHAIRNGRPYIWLWILFIFPFLGSIVYFVAEYLPHSRMPYQVNTLSKKALHVLQPNRQLNQLKENYEHLPSVENAVHYADALVSSGKAVEAILILEQKNNGFCAEDPAFLEKFARALLQDQQSQRVLEITQKIRNLQPNFRSEEIALLRALSYHQLNQEDLAHQEFSFAIRSKNISILSEYIFWAIQTNQPSLAHEIRAEMQRSWAIWSKYARRLHKPIFTEVDKALKQMDKNVRTS